MSISIAPPDVIGFASPLCWNGDRRNAGQPSRRCERRPVSITGVDTVGDDFNVDVTRVDQSGYAAIGPFRGFIRRCCPDALAVGLAWRARYVRQIACSEA